MFAKWKRTAATLALLISLGQSAGSAQAQDIDVTMVLPALTLSFAAAWIADDAGLYKKHGLNVTTRQLVGVAGNNAVINGSAEFGLTTGGTYLNGVAKGQRLLLLANMVSRPSSELILRKDVADSLGITDQMPLEQKIRAIKGKTIGLNAIASSPHAWLRLLAQKAGLDAENDIRVAVVESAAQTPSLQANKIDGVVGPPPFTTQAIVKLGAVVLASPVRGDLPDYYPTASIVLQTRPEVCKQSREKCLRMTRAIQDAVQMIKEKPAETWEIVKKRNANMDQDVLVGAWADTVSIFTTDMRITEKMLDLAQQYSLDAGFIDPKDKVTDYKGLFTDEYLK